jgi:hypothetical protein
MSPLGPVPTSASFRQMFQAPHPLTPGLGRVAPGLCARGVLGGPETRGLVDHGFTMVLPWFYILICVFFTMVFTMMCVFFSDVLTCSTNFQILKGRVCAIYSILFADLLNEWGLWSSTSLYQGLDENCRWIRNHSPYIRPTFTSLLQQLQSTASYFSLSLK